MTSLVSVFGFLMGNDRGRVQHGGSISCSRIRGIIIQLKPERPGLQPVNSIRLPESADVRRDAWKARSAIERRTEKLRSNPPRCARFDHAFSPILGTRNEIGLAQHPIRLSFAHAL